MEFLKLKRVQTLSWCSRSVSCASQNFSTRMSGICHSPLSPLPRLNLSLAAKANISLSLKVDNLHQSKFDRF